MAVTPNLPPDVIEEILSCLPVKPLLRFRCVSKYWHTLLTTNPNFVRKHLTRTIQNDENHGFILQTEPLREYYSITDSTLDKAVKLQTPFIEKKICMRTVGSLNGLVCLFHWKGATTDDTFVYIWNPAIREYNTISRPQVKTELLKFRSTVSIGFGYNPASNDYTVVECVRCESNTDDWNEAEIYSFKANSWRKQLLPGWLFTTMLGECINGVVHWIVGRGTGKRYDFILGFDVADGVFQEMPLPNNLPNYSRPGDFSFITLHIYKECLSVCSQYDQLRNFEIWVLKEYGFKDSWTKLFNFENPDYELLGVINPVLFFKNGEILFDVLCGNLLYSYNIESGHLQKLPVEESSYVEVVPYVESLVWPVACNAVERQVTGSDMGDGN